MPRSPLCWSKKSTPTDLLELILALWEEGVICYADGSRAEFNDIVQGFEAMLNIKVNDLRALKSRTLNRKLKPTKFLDRLKVAFMALCQR